MKDDAALCAMSAQNEPKTGQKGNGRKRGAPVGNRNAERTGLYADYWKLPAGEARSTRIRNYVNIFRRRVEAELLERYGDIDIFRAKITHTCVKSLQAALECHHRRREHEHELSHAEWLQFRDKEIRFLEVGDKCLRVLGLDREVSAANVWDVITAARNERVDGPTSVMAYDVPGSTISGTGDSHAVSAPELPADATITDVRENHRDC